MYRCGCIHHSCNTQVVSPRQAKLNCYTNKFLYTLWRISIGVKPAVSPKQGSPSLPFPLENMHSLSSYINKGFSQCTQGYPPNCLLLWYIWQKNFDTFDSKIFATITGGSAECLPVSQVHLCVCVFVCVCVCVGGWYEDVSLLTLPQDAIEEWTGSLSKVFGSNTDIVSLVG